MAPMHPTRYWHGLDDGRVQCDVCPRFCKLQEGQRGMCFVRANHEHAVVLTTYGQSSGFCIDPMEKKPLNHFLPGTPILSFGTAGCNLACSFCQNWDISKIQDKQRAERALRGRLDPALPVEGAARAPVIDTLANQASPVQIAKAAKDSGCSSVAFTYNDPVVFMEYAMDVADACHDVGIKAVAVTAGYICPEPRVEFYRHMDAANVDLKGFTERFYADITKGHLQPVLDTLVYLKKETRVWFEITTLLIPGENDSEEEIDQETQWIMDHLGPDVPLHFTAFHPDYRMLDKKPTPSSTLKRSRDIAMRNGLRYVYTGNVHDPAGQSTYCHHCKNILIGRNGYEITAWHLTPKDTCARCGTPCPGVF